MARDVRNKGSEKPKRAKKKRSRLEVSSDESDGSAEQNNNEKIQVAVTEGVIDEDVQKPKKDKKKKKKKSASASVTPIPAEIDIDTSTAAAENLSTDELQSPAAPSLKSQSPRQEEDFGSVYLRKITAELGDDIDKVRNANDFTGKSLPMLIHALKQGEVIYSPEEKKRVTGVVYA